MKQDDATPRNVENREGLGKRQPTDKASASKFSAAYWKPRIYRPTYTKPDGTRAQVAQFYARLQHGGTQKEVPLASNALNKAAARAAKLYQTLKASGWDAALALFRPDSEPKAGADLRIGDYLAMVEEIGGLPRRTQAGYFYALRKIASEVVGVKIDGNRFDPTGKWKRGADGIPLARVTPGQVEAWRVKFRKTHGGDQIREQRASRSANSYIRNGRALFSRRLLDLVAKRGVRLPSPLPFEGVRLQNKTGSTRYRSTIDASALLQAAKTELLETDPDAYAVILLALVAGLRRSEIDAMQWQNVDATRGIVRVATTAQRRAKSEESEGDVHVDAGLFAELERTRRPGRTLYVVEPDREHRPSKAACFYRCEDSFARVTGWLRSKGVLSDRPLHTLRKEFGSIVAAAGDIFQASRQLRHAQLSTTEQYYADTRKVATVPLADLLKVQKEAK